MQVEPRLELVQTVTESFTAQSASSKRIASTFESSAKRLLDILLAAAGLSLASPLLLIGMIGICVSSAGSPIFSQYRVGMHGKRFRMYKLRTMNIGSHTSHEAVVLKSRNDPRIFPVGGILRRLSIDELPNLVNVLIGNMSIVGPRPMLANEIDYCALRHGQQAVDDRLLVKPGITGLWQVSGRADLHFDQRVELDIKYAMSWTFWGDVSIILKTIPALVFARGAF